MQVDFLSLFLSKAVTVEEERQPDSSSKVKPKLRLVAGRIIAAEFGECMGRSLILQLYPLSLSVTVIGLKPKACEHVHAQNLQALKLANYFIY